MAFSVSIIASMVLYVIVRIDWVHIFPENLLILHESLSFVFVITSQIWGHC